MTTLALTADRIAQLLTIAEDHNLWQENDGTAAVTDHETFGVSEILDRPTGDVAQLAAAGLLETHTSEYATTWRATTAGAEWLLNHLTGGAA